MERAGKQQETQHPIHDDGAEVDLQQRRRQGVEEVLSGEGDIDADQNERYDDAHDEQADRVRQRKKFVIEPSEQRRKRQQDRGQVEKRKHVFVGSVLTYGRIRSTPRQDESHRGDRRSPQWDTII